MILVKYSKLYDSVDIDARKLPRSFQFFISMATSITWIALDFLGNA